MTNYRLSITDKTDDSLVLGVIVDLGNMSLERYRGHLWHTLKEMRGHEYANNMYIRLEPIEGLDPIDVFHMVVRKALEGME